jgi:YkoY family integral membrane protein
MNMGFINNIINNYSHFFSADYFVSTVTNTSNWMIIFSLIIMEGLLSSDNALVLAMMVKHLPEKQQKKALTYGIWGAYLFRILAIGIGTYLIKIWWVKVIAAGYLLKMAFDFFFRKNDEGEEDVKAIGKGLWGTILTVELMDIAFSIDSVTAAFGVSNQMWVLFLGAVFGILMMRGVAKLFVTLIERVPELESGAYILIAIIGFKMIAELFHIVLPDYLFFAMLVLVFTSVFAVHKFKGERA